MLLVLHRINHTRLNSYCFKLSLPHAPPIIHTIPFDCTCYDTQYKKFWYYNYVLYMYTSRLELFGVCLFLIHFRSWFDCSQELFRCSSDPIKRLVKPCCMSCTLHIHVMLLSVVGVTVWFPFWLVSLRERGRGRPGIVGAKQPRHHRCH